MSHFIISPQEMRTFHTLSALKQHVLVTTNNTYKFQLNLYNFLVNIM